MQVHTVKNLHIWKLVRDQKVEVERQMVRLFMYDVEVDCQLEIERKIPAASGSRLRCVWRSEKSDLFSMQCTKAYKILM